MERVMKLYENKVYGEEVSKYGLENEYLDYLTLAKIIGPCIMNNYLRAKTMEDRNNGIARIDQKWMLRELWSS